MTIVKGEKYTRVRLQQTVQRRVTYTYVLMDVTVRQQEDTVCEMLKHRCSEQNDGRHHEILNHPAPARPTSLSLSLFAALHGHHIHPLQPSCASYIARRHCPIEVHSTGR
jgi:hypothetical protein